MEVFSRQAGRVAIIPDAGFPMRIGLQGWQGAPVMRSVITQMALSSTGNFQFMHTLRNFIYVYIFGERMGEITISGMAFAGDCQPFNTSGLEKVLSYYGAFRVSKLGAPLAIAIGASTTFHGFLTGIQTNIADPQTGLAQFGLRFNFFPN